MPNSQPNFEAGYSARFQPSSPCPWTSTWFGKTLPSSMSRSPCSPLFARPTPLTVSLIQDGGISFRIITRSNPILLQYFGGKELQTGFWCDTDTIHGKLCILLFTSSRFVSFSQISNSIIQAWSRHLADT